IVRPMPMNRSAKPEPNSPYPIERAPSETCCVASFSSALSAAVAGASDIATISVQADTVASQRNLRAIADLPRVVGRRVQATTGVSQHDHFWLRRARHRV